MAKEIGAALSCGSTNVVVSRKYIILNFNLFLETVPGMLWSKTGCASVGGFYFWQGLSAKEKKNKPTKETYLILVKQ